MSDYKIKIKIGEHEFEAEGPVEAVQSQFATFKELLATMADQSSVKASLDVKPAVTPPATQPGTNNSGTLPLEKIMRNEGRVISLTVHADSIEDAVLVILLGQRQFRSNDSVTGSEIMDGLRESGQTAPRVDYLLDRLAAQGNVIRIGEHRARRYRLTNAGMVRAQEIARALISIVP